jgi:hypothetical protein
MDDDIRAVHERAKSLPVGQVTQHDIELQACELGMIDGLPGENSDAQTPGGERPDDVAPKKTCGARDRDQPTHDECST